MTLPAQKAVVHDARQMTINFVTALGQPDEADLAALVVSELLTNALRHAPCERGVAFRLDCDGTALCICVADDSTNPPVVMHPGALSEGKHGLEIVEAITTGVKWRIFDEGKVVYAIMVFPRQSEAPARNSAATAA